MIPSSWLAVFGFFVFAAPGLMFDLLAASKRVERRESAFREVGRTILVSTACTAIAAPLVVSVAPSATTRLPSTAVVPTAREILLGDRKFVADHVAGLSILVAATLAISLALSFVAYRVRFRNVEAQVSYDSQWTGAFRSRRPKAHDVAVQVRLKNQTVWFGVVRDFSIDLEMADRELTLRPPLAVRKLNEQKLNSIKHLDTGWAQVILKGDEIESIMVRYQRDRSGPQHERQQISGSSQDL